MKIAPRLLAMLCGLFAVTVQAAQQPNFVFILIDDLPWYGTSVRMDPELPTSSMVFRRMPNLESIAKNGMVFQNAYAGAGMCAPARCCIQTGMTAARHLYSGNGGFGPKTDGTVEYFAKAEDAKRPLICPEPQGNIRHPSIGTVLKSAGYTTATFGKWHLYGGGPEKHGYDFSDGETDNKTCNPAIDPKTKKKMDLVEDPKMIFGITQLGVNFMETAVKQDKPFFLMLSHYATHAYYQCRPETFARVEKYSEFDSLRTDPKDAKQLRSTQVAAGMCEDLDDSIGIVLNKLKELGVADNTYVIFTSDNGYQGWNMEHKSPLRGAKWWLWQDGIRVAMVVSGPSVPKGSRTSVNVVNYDYLPTLAELAGASQYVSKEVDGVSFKPVLFGQPVDDAYKNRFLYFHYPHYRNSPPASAIISGDWKVLHFYETPDKQLLFNVKDDMGETKNLAAAQPERAASMLNELMSQIKRVGGYFPKPNPDADPKYTPYDPDDMKFNYEGGDD